MVKTAVVYYSKHHGNTKKVLDYMCKDKDVDLIDVSTASATNLEKYDLIGFASGIYYSKFHKTVLKTAQNALPEGKNVFFVYTYGAKKDGYTNAIREVVKNKSANIVGEYGCFGFNTFGPFKLIGGMAKGHPDNTELENAKQFFENIG